MTLQDTGQHERVSAAHKPLELVELLGLGRSTIYKMLRAGTIRSVKAGRRTVVPADAVAEFLQGKN
jgi:excisionase family DNA binding protein